VIASARLLAVLSLGLGAGPAAATPGAPDLAVTASPAPPPATSRPIGFDEAIARARTRAVVSQVGVQEVRRADGLLAQARSGSLPQLGLGGAITRLDARRTSGGALLAPERQASGTAQATLALSASRWYQWSHAGDQLEAALAGSDDAVRFAVLTAARAYLTVVGEKRIIEVTRRSVDAAQAHFDFARARRQAGVGNALDELRAEQQLAAAQAQLEGVLVALARTQEALGQATGDDAPLDAAAEPALEVPPADEPTAAALARRADLRAAGARATAASRLARDSWADWLPTLLGSYTAFRQDWQTAASPGRGWQAQIVLSFPVFEGGLRVGQARERNALDAEASTLLDGLLRQARSEVRAAWAALQHAEAAYRESARAADRAERALVLVAQAYQAGSTNSLDVTDAEQRARDAGTSAAVAEDAVRQARLDLLAATGHFP
jgi:outer membrane protein